MSVPRIDTQTKTTRTTMYYKTNYHYFQPAIQLLKTCTRQPAHMEHTKYTTIRTNWYIQQTRVGATNRHANKNNKNYHVLQNQLPLLSTRNTTAKDLYKTTCTHGAHKIHNYKNKLVHTASPFRVYRRGPCPRVQMRPLTACTDEAPPLQRVHFPLLS